MIGNILFLVQIRFNNEFVEIFIAYQVKSSQLFKTIIEYQLVHFMIMFDIGSSQSQWIQYFGILLQD